MIMTGAGIEFRMVFYNFRIEFYAGPFVDSVDDDEGYEE